jgi:(2Fe-2S) ferredoxin
MNEEGQESQCEVTTELQQALEIWCCDKVATKYGCATLCNIGPSLVMAEKIWDQHVDCAQYGKIKTIANIEQETKWSNAIKYGSEILEIIKSHYHLAVVDLPLSQAMQSWLTTVPDQVATRNCG